MNCLEIIESSDIENWNEEEIEKVGKIGFDSTLFEGDPEDYSQW